MKPQDRTRAILRSKAEPSVRLLLVAIADHMNDEDICWVKPDTIAEETGLAESTVNKLIGEAEEAGLLRRWWGDHRSKDVAIVWTALASYTPKPSGRGGNRPPKTGDSTPNIGPHTPTIGVTEGSDNRSPGVRSSVERGPNIGPQDSDNRTRSVHEATNEATREAPTAHATPSGHGPPADLIALLGPARHDLARRLAQYVDVPRLLAKSEDEVRRIPGIGPDRAAMVAELCRDAGWPLAEPKVEPIPAWRLPAAKAEAAEDAWRTGATGNAEAETILRGDYDAEWRGIGMTEDEINTHKRAAQKTVDAQRRAG